MNGGASEYVSAYLNNENYILETNGSSIINTNLKYKDVYDEGIGDNSSDNYSANGSIYGDAIYETSSRGTLGYSWFSETSEFPYYVNTFFERGGPYMDSSQSGIFNFRYYNGRDYDLDSFRPVLAVF